MFSFQTAASVRRKPVSEKRELIKCGPQMATQHPKALCVHVPSLYKDARSSRYTNTGFQHCYTHHALDIERGLTPLFVLSLCLLLSLSLCLSLCLLSLIKALAVSTCFYVPVSCFCILSLCCSLVRLPHPGSIASLEQLYTSLERHLSDSA